MALSFMEREITPEGTIHDYYYDTDRDGVVVNSSYNVDKLFEQNLQSRNSGTNGFNKERDVRKIAELDSVTIHKLLVEHNIDVFNKDDMPALKKWLRQSENSKFRTVHGRF